MELVSWLIWVSLPVVGGVAGPLLSQWPCITLVSTTAQLSDGRVLKSTGAWCSHLTYLAAQS